MYLNLQENIQIAWTQLKSSKLRSILTTLGITIGIATVIFIVAILEGYNLSITEDMQGLGANVFQLEKYDRSGGFDHRRREVRKDLKKEYAKEIREKCDVIRFVGAEVWNYGISFRYKDKKTNPSYTLGGGEPEYFYNNAEPVDRGRIISRSDVISNARVTVIAKDIVDDLFPYEDPLGKYIKIAGIKFQVIGTFEDLGTRTFGQSANNRAVIPITTFEDIFGKYRSVFITVQAIDVSHVEEAKSQVIGVLRKIRKIPPGEPNDFEIWSNDSLMNIMLVTVTERTREIGIRKAVGAKRQAILIQFLIESIFLSFIGGFFGVLLGFLLAFFISSAFDIPFAVPMWSVVSALLVTSIVGLFAGIYPAAKASKLDPIESHRYE